MGNMSFIYTRSESRTLRESNKQLARMPEHVGMKTNKDSLFKMWNYNVVNKNFKGSLFEMT